MTDSTAPPGSGPASDNGRPMASAGLDWSGRDGAPLATVGELAACFHCRRPTLLRHPDTGQPCHKVCEEAHLNRTDSGRSSTLDGAP